MKFLYNHNSDPTYSNPLTILRENNKFEILRYSDNKCAIYHRKPRKDSKYYDPTRYLIWDLKNKCAIKKVLDLSSAMPKANWE
jgi:hypothetical protein